MSFVTAASCGIEHHEWLKAIDFYDQELDILEKRLAEIINKNTGTDAMAGAGHFQNQFIVQRNNIDELRHAIREHDHKTADDAFAHGGHIHSELVSEHAGVKENFSSFEKVIKDIRSEFNDYLAKWM
ncbi:MAG: hypothetical protein K2X48_15005 [Chitinophagaceae bacterium]|nr:hypothetical protein [Chitinophagaceae bacterium]